MRREEMNTPETHCTSANDYKKRNGRNRKFTTGGMRATFSHVRESYYRQDLWILTGRPDGRIL